MNSDRTAHDAANSVDAHAVTGWFCVGCRGPVVAGDADAAVRCSCGSNLFREVRPVRPGGGAAPHAAHASVR